MLESAPPALRSAGSAATEVIPADKQKEFAT